jgi:hypothetical protein
MDIKEYRENRRHVSWDALARHRGEWVAFGLDGKRVLAGDPDLERLGEALMAQGQDLQQVVFEYVPGPDDDSTLDRVESL